MFSLLIGTINLITCSIVVGMASGDAGYGFAVFLFGTFLLSMFMTGC